jgi:hypothetical protein
MASQVSAEVSGPIIRCLGNGYFLVQCNRQQLKPDDQVIVLRSGQEVARGQVMRQEGSVCSILIRSGNPQRLDTVVLASPSAEHAERGPGLPLSGQTVKAAPKATEAGKAKPKKDYFGSFDSGGQVYQLNTGQFLTP